MWQGNMEIRSQLIAASISMNALGINQGMSGNLSSRVEGGFLITPSGIPYASLTPVDIAFVDLPSPATTSTDSDSGYCGPLQPSSEWRMHRDVYMNFPNCMSIVHTHSPYATALSSLRKQIPAFHYMVGVAGGKSIPCAEYRTFGTQSLSDEIVSTLKEHKVTGCLLANHGVICYTSKIDVNKTIGVAVEIETLAKQYHLAKSFNLGEPHILDDAEMDIILAKFATYGKKEEEVACLCEFDQLNRIVSPEKRG